MVDGEDRSTGPCPTQLAFAAPSPPRLHRFGDESSSATALPPGMDAAPGTPAQQASDEAAVTPPRFEAMGVTKAANPNFQTVKVKVAVGAHIDLMVVRGVRMRDVASDTTSEPGILTLNAEHIRFKSDPSASGDGYSMITYLDNIPSEPTPRRVGGTLGGLWEPYSIELPRRELHRSRAAGGSSGSSSSEEPTFCHLIFGTNQTACDAFLAKLLEQQAIASEKQPLNAVAEEGGVERMLQLEPRTPSRGLSSISLGVAVAAPPQPRRDPVKLEFVRAKELNHEVTVYVVTCTFKGSGAPVQFEHRFRDFQKLRDDVVDLFPRADGWEFPKKQIYGKMDAAVIEARRKGLQSWCDIVINENRNLGPAAWAVVVDFVQNVTADVSTGHANVSTGHATRSFATSVKVSPEVCKNDDFCIQNEEFCIKNEECVSNRGMCVFKMSNFAGV